MSRLDLSRSSKGLMQRMEAMVRATLPRQARVTRTEGNSVWVKFLGDGANDPESKFPSTVSGVPVATMGWVITLGGRKGLFVATGIAIPQKPKRGTQWSTQPISTAGDYTWTLQTALLTFSDLTPGTSYELSWTVNFNWWTSAAATGQIGARVTDSDGDRLVLAQSRPMRHTGATGTTPDERSWSYSETVVARPDGTVQVCPAFRWESGTTNFQQVYILARID